MVRRYQSTKGVGIARVELVSSIVGGQVAIHQLLVWDVHRLLGMGKKKRIQNQHDGQEDSFGDFESLDDRI